MRVLHLTTSFPKHKNDFSGLFVYRLVRSLAEQGTDCRVLTPAHTRNELFPDDVPTLRFNYAPRRWQILGESPGGIPQVLKKTPSLACLLAPFLTSFMVNILKYARNADLIHAHWSVCGAIAVITRPLHGKPIVTTLRGSDTLIAGRDLAYSWVHRLSVLGSEVSVGVSRHIVDDLEAGYPRMQDRFRFISNGVEDQFYSISPLSRPETDPVKLLFAGSLIALKGVDVLFKALGQLDAQYHWTLTVAGDGAERDALVRLAYSLGIQDRVAFVGVVPPERMASLMGEHHALVLPSRHEGRPNIILEAMAAGLPVIATDINGVRDLVHKGITGFVVPPDDEVGFADALECAVRKPEELRRLGVAGRDWVIEEGLSWETTAAKYAAIYEELVKGRRALSRGTITPGQCSVDDQYRVPVQG